jgi:hypothetical protein
MKKVNPILTMILFVMAGCIGCNQSATQSDELITVDVTASYPRKELILQDCLDVEYLPLETNDEFLCEGYVQAVGKDIVVVKNRTGGDIFLFNRKGKALRKINRNGQGAEEYTGYLRIILDEDQDELFVDDNDTRKIVVYDLNGNFKRSFKHKEDARYENVYNFDRENLICHDGSVSNDGQSFMVISKQDGSITREIQIPFDKKRFPRLSKKDEAKNITYVIAPSTYYPIIPYHDNWILVEPSSDTIYSYSPDHTMTPLIVRTPPIQSMDPEVMLFTGAITDRYYFMVSVKMKGDVMAMTGLESVDLLYDRQEKALFRGSVYNDDYSGKEQAYMSTQPLTNEIATWQYLNAFELIEAYKKGRLKGRLKEIAAGLDEDSNPVIMLAKHKNN